MCTKKRNGNNAIDIPTQITGTDFMKAAIYKN